MFGFTLSPRVMCSLLGDKRQRINCFNFYDAGSISNVPSPLISGPMNCLKTIKGKEAIGSKYRLIVLTPIRDRCGKNKFTSVIKFNLGIWITYEVNNVDCDLQEASRAIAKIKTEPIPKMEKLHKGFSINCFWITSLRNVWLLENIAVFNQHSFLSSACFVQPTVTVLLDHDWCNFRVCHFLFLFLRVAENCNSFSM